MHDAEKKAVLGICLMASFADGEKSDLERKQLERVGEGLGLGPLDVPEFYEHAASGVLSGAALGETLQTRENRLLAYEMALGVCEADDHLNGGEQTFLKELQRVLELDDASIQTARSTTHQLQSQVLAPVAPPPIMAASLPAPVAPPVAGVDRLILEHAILCGALELLPETLATMAILPTQMRMVYQIGRQYGVTLDRGHIKDFLLTAGVGLTSQVLEGYATKLAKGLLGKVLGGLGRAAAGPLTGAAFSFCTTYALGHAANQYYAGGRVLSKDHLRAMFDSLMTKAQGLQAGYAPEIQTCRRNLRLQNLLPGAAA